MAKHNPEELFRALTQGMNWGGTLKMYEFTSPPPPPDAVNELGLPLGCTIIDGKVVKVTEMTMRIVDGNFVCDFKGIEIPPTH